MNKIKKEIIYKACKSMDSLIEKIFSNQFSKSSPNRKKEKEKEKEYETTLYYYIAKILNQLS